MYIAFNRDSKRIQSIAKVFLTKEDRAALYSLQQLPDELKVLVTDEIVHVNAGTFSKDINELGYPNSKGQRFPITWLNSPADCHRHMAADPKNSLRLIFRTPKLPADVKYDFPRVLIAKAFQN